ncbi:MAG: repeat protein [Acidobacteria bacterium]|nr:repeat protein [Acidobacteriota bacterium]
MKHISCVGLLVLVAAAGAPDLAAKGKQAQTPQPDMCIVPPGAQPLLPAKLLPGMGITKDFPVTTTSEEARKFFLQGVSQIHSFWFQESERSCTQALELDKDMAMAYWCIALSAASDYRPAFQLLRDPASGGARNAPAAEASADATVARSTTGAAIDPQIRAREAIAKAMALRDKVTPRERLYIEAQAARRATGHKDAADAAYIATLRTLVAAYPDDLEAKSMLGLAIDNGFEPASKQPREHTMEAIALLEEVVAKDDGQFGAHHYLIHAYEGSKMPEKAWHANQRYAGLVTNIPHALHMPGHIYAQSDKIQEAISAFSAAAANEQKWLAADTLYPNGHYGHNVHFLIHALNLGGRYDDSMKWVQDLFTYKENPRERSGNNQRTVWRQGYFGVIKSTVRFEKWSEILDGRTIPVYDKPEQNAWRHWAMGLAYSATGQADKAKAALADLHKDLDSVTSPKEPLGIAAQELEATIAARGGDRKKAYELYRKAADREAHILYTEPPAYPRPVVEGWGNVALALGDYGAAEKAYREALEREPGSGRAFFGVAASLEGQGKNTEAQEAKARAAKAWANADPALPQVQKLRTSTAAVAPQ